MQDQREVDLGEYGIPKKYNKMVKSAVQYSQDHYQDITKSMSTADRTLRAFVSEHPFAAVGCAVAFGYVVARSINGIRR